MSRGREQERALSAGVPSAALSRARATVIVLFTAYGFLFASAVPRYPQIQRDLALSNTGFGLALAAYAGASLLAGVAVAAVIRRAGSAVALTAGIVGLAAATALIGAAHSGWTLAAAFALAGTVDPLIDVAANRQGLRIQAVYGRSILVGLHASWCLGAVAGGLAGTTAAGLHLSVATQLAGTALAAVLLAAATYRRLLPEDRPGDTRSPADPSEPGGRPRARLLRVVAGLGVLAALGAVIEDAAASWSAIYLTRLGAAAVAGLGYVALQAAMTLARLLADRAVDRWGHRSTARAGCLAAAAAMLAALAGASVPVTVVALGAVGAGTATLIPAAVHTADHLPGLRTGTGVTIVSWLQRSGGLLASPLIGTLADGVGLRAALGIIPAAALTAAGLAALLTARHRAT